MPPPDQFDVFNDTDDPLPAGGLCQWAGGVTSAGAVKVVKPAADSAPNLIVCGPHGIAPRSAGLGTFAPAVVVAFDATGGTPAVGDTLGSRAGSFLAKKGNTGFVCFGGASGPWALCARAAPATGGAPNHLAPARVATTANVNVLGGGLAAGTVHDGVTLAAGDRVLVRAQSSPNQNGVYVAPASGAAARASDASTGAQVYGAVVPVTNGTLHGDSLWQCAANAEPTVGSDSLPWVKIGPADGAAVRVRAVVSHKVVGGALVTFGDSTTWSSGVQNGSAWDGVTLATGDLILVTDLFASLAGALPGVYRVQASGAPVRAYGFDTDASMHGLSVSVAEGAALAGTTFVGSASGGNRRFTRAGRPWAGTVRFARASSTGSGLAAGFATDGVTAAEGDRYATLNNGAVYVVQASGYTGSHVPALDCPPEYLNRGALVRVTSGTEYGGTTYFNNGSAWQFVGPAATAWQNVPLSGPVDDVSALGTVPRQSVQVVEPLYLIDFPDLLLSGTGTRLYVGQASAVAPGVVSTGTQEFEGAKTFLADATFSGDVIGLGTATFDGNLTSFGTIQSATGQNIAAGGIFRVGNGGPLVDGFTGTPGPGFTAVGGLITGGGSGSFVGTASSNAFTNTNSFAAATTFSAGITGTTATFSGAVSAASLSGTYDAGTW